MRRFLFSSPSFDPFYNLAVENWLLNSENFIGSELIFIYRNRPCIVIGRNQNSWAECNVSQARQQGVPILRRFSGGGAVIHDLGNWNYSYHVDRDYFYRSTGAQFIINALDPNQQRLSLSARHDIYDGDAKVSGSAFKITRRRAYHHGTMLLESDLTSLLPLLLPNMEILAPDRDCPFGGVSSVRAGKVANFDGCSVSSFPQLIEKAFRAPQAIPPVALADLEADQRLLKSWEWTFGKSPAFKARVNNEIVHVVEGRVEGRPFDEFF